jgi:hypothetical protein
VPRGDLLHVGSHLYYNDLLMQMSVIGIPFNDEYTFATAVFVHVHTTGWDIYEDTVVLQLETIYRRSIFTFRVILRTPTENPNPLF